LAKRMNQLRDRLIKWVESLPSYNHTEGQTAILKFSVHSTTARP
jgi:hypothetical protein